jgi:hypothetical protein
MKMDQIGGVSAGYKSASLTKPLRAPLPNVAQAQNMPEKAGQVPARIEQLANMVDFCQEALSTLESRLLPITNRNLQEGRADGDAEKQALVPMADRLETIISVLIMHRDRIQNIIARLEI